MEMANVTASVTTPIRLGKYEVIMGCDVVYLKARRLCYEPDKHSIEEIDLPEFGGKEHANKKLEG